MKRLSEERKLMILNTFASGKSLNDIAFSTGVSKAQVFKVLKENNLKTLNTITGRQKKLSLRKEKQLTRKFINKELLNATDGLNWIKNNFNISVSSETVRNILKKHGLKCHKKKTKCSLNNTHIKKRLKFATLHKNYTFFYWNKIIFSDESKFNMHGSDGASKVWCNMSEIYKQNNIKSIKKFGGGNIMVWGCITSKGVGKLIKITNSMNSKEYCKVLYDGLIATYEMYNLSFSNHVFMQDNAACHVSRETKSWLNTNNIQCLEWPPCSPDLNPIEHVWDYLEKKLRARFTTFTDHNEMYQIIEEEWYKIDSEYIKKLYFSMCSRIKQVIISKGDNTKY